MAVIRRMARDLDLLLPHADAIIGVPTVREPDGLALSSRNRYLDAEHRAKAAVLPRAMRDAITSMETGGAIGDALVRLEETLRDGGFSKIDYAALADAATLQRIDTLGDRPARLLVAAHIGGTRLIDNMAVNAPS